MIAPWLPRYFFWDPSTWSIPKLYWDAKSPEERIHAICIEIAKLVGYADFTSSKLNELKETVDTLQDKFPDIIDDDVRARIDELIENGTIESIIGDYIQENIFDDICYVHKVGILPYERTGTGYPNMQGGCLSEGGNFVQYQIKGNTEENRVSVCSLNTGRTLRETTGRFGHGNAVAYHDGKIYITGGADDEYSQSIHVLDYETLEVLDRIEGVSYYGLQYLDAIGAWVAMNTTWGSTEIDNQKLYILNDDFTVKSEKDFSGMNIGKSSAGMGIVDNMICILSLEPTNIVLFDQNLNFIKTIELNRNIDFMHYASEFEWIDGTKDNVYFGIRLFGRGNANAGNHLIASSSLVSSFQGGSPAISSVSREFVETVYVDEPSNWKWYETGMQDAPFSNPYLIGNAAQIRELSRLYVNLKSGYTYDFEIGFEDCDCVVTLRSSDDPGSSDNLVKFTGKLYVNNSEVITNNVQFGIEIESPDFRIVCEDAANLTLARTRYGANEKILLNTSSSSNVKLGAFETDFNLVDSLIRAPITFTNRVSVSGILYLNEKPDMAGATKNYFKGLQNMTDSVTNDNTGTVALFYPSAIVAPSLMITLTNENNVFAFCELNLASGAQYGAPIYFPNNPTLHGGIRSTNNATDSNWAGANLIPHIVDSANDNADVTSQWKIRYIRVYA